MPFDTRTLHKKPKQPHIRIEPNGAGEKNGMLKKANERDLARLLYANPQSVETTLYFGYRPTDE